MDFPCIQCGLCCKTLRHIPTLQDYDMGNGVCRYLHGAVCSIYEDRPTLCNINEMYSLHFESMMNRMDFFIENLKSCIAIAEQFREISIKEKLEAKLKIFMDNPGIGTFSRNFFYPDTIRRISQGKIGE